MDLGWAPALVGQVRDGAEQRLWPSVRPQDVEWRAIPAASPTDLRSHTVSQRADQTICLPTSHIPCFLNCPNCLQWSIARALPPCSPNESRHCLSLLCRLVVLNLQILTPWGPFTGFLYQMFPLQLLTETKSQL